MLLGLVVLVVGAGVIGASGAFTSVEADRTMDIQTTGDSSALLGLEGGDSSIATTEDSNSDAADTVDVLTIRNSTINEDAITKFDDVFTATNNGNENIGKFYIEADSNIGLDAGGSGPIDFKVDGESIISGDDGNTNYASLGSQGGSVVVNLTIDTTGGTDQGDLPSSGTITIVAEE